MNKMHQRLRDFERASGLEIYGLGARRDKWEHAMEQFAKMIVIECADICNKIYFERYPDAEDFERSEEGDAIKKHFGVEE